jgi:hypothetical protein
MATFLLTLVDQNNFVICDSSIVRVRTSEVLHLAVSLGPYMQSCLYHYACQLVTAGITERARVDLKTSAIALTVIVTVWNVLTPVSWGYRRLVIMAGAYIAQGGLTANCLTRSYPHRRHMIRTCMRVCRY